MANRTRYFLLLSSILVITPCSLWAGTNLYSDDTLGPVASGSFAQSSFGLNSFESLTPSFLAGEPGSLESLVMSSAVNRVGNSRYRLLSLHSENNSVYVPLYKSKSYADGTADPFQAWGVKWQHRLNAGHSFAVAANLGSNVYQEPGLILGETTSAMAEVSWTTRLTGNSRPSVTGSVFYGDEMATKQSDSQFGRTYYGFTVGGRMTIYDTHTPYVSFKLQKSNYIFDETLGWAGFDDNYFSRLSAGWSWQVQNNWSLKAEANYVLSDSELDWSFNNSKLFFGTRYDFR
jgi:hypothetical protein